MASASQPIPARNFVDVLRRRALCQGPAQAYTYLHDHESSVSLLTYGELDSHARRIAAGLQQRGLAGQRILLFCEGGLEYVSAFFGCLYAGALAVPLHPPHRKPSVARLASISRDASATTALATSTLISTLGPLLKDIPDFADFRWLDVSAITGGEAWEEPAIDAATPALLQYTSGSTGNPRGVVISHGNLMHNQHVIRHTFGVTDESVVVNWLPLYHDMGLIGGLLHPLYAGAQCVLMPPASFLRRPLRWLKAISQYGGTVSGAPNFAYDLCVDRIKPESREDLDLSRWTVAFNGAEPVRYETLQRFAAAYKRNGFRIESFRPCYGLAESTLMVTGKSDSAPPNVFKLSRKALARNEVAAAAATQDDESDNAYLVGCGSPHQDHEIAVVDVQKRRKLRPGEIGEICVAGPSVAQGYWNRPEDTGVTFGESLLGLGNPSFLRTGDLGFIHDDQLFVTGRLKDLIIINGRNVYPQDVERVVEESHPALARNGGAAFSVEVDGVERLVVAHEVQRPRPAPDFEEIAGTIRSAVADRLELSLHTVVLLNTGAIPKTTSGKVKRHACRSGFLDGSLEEILHRDQVVAANSQRNGGHGASTATPASPSGANRDVSRKSADELIQWLRTYADERINSRLIDERRCIPPHIVLDFGNQGLLGMQVGTSHGGLALCNSDVVRVIGQLAAIDLTLALFVGNNNALGVRPIQQYGDKALRDKILPVLATGRELAAFALTEPGAGSNPRAIAAKGTPDSKGGWRLSGTKVWIGSASWAGFINVFVQLAGAPGETGGFTAFCLRQGTAGLRHGPEALTMGMRGMVQNAIYLNDVSASRDELLGKEGGGWEVGQDAMMFGRLGLGAASAGGMKRCAQLMLRYARRRPISSGRLLDNPVTLARFSELTASIRALELLVSRTAELLDDGCTVPSEVLVACKIIGTESLWRAADDLVQMLGGRGYLESNIAAQLLRDARVFRIFEGPTETLASFLGADALHRNDALDRFMGETLNAPDVCNQLHRAGERVRAHYFESGRLFPDSAPAIRQAHFAMGQVTCCAILLAFVKEASARNPGKELDRVVAWSEWQLARMIEAALDSRRDPLMLGPGSVLDVVSAYSDTIGDIEQTLAGEDGTLDWLLRRDTGTSVSHGDSPASPVARRNSPLAAQSQPQAQLKGREADDSRRAARSLEKWLTEWLARETRIPPEGIHVGKPFADFGMDSATATALVVDLEKFLGRRLEITLVWDYPTISALALYLAAKPDSDAVTTRDSHIESSTALN